MMKAFYLWIDFYGCMENIFVTDYSTGTTLLIVYVFDGCFAKEFSRISHSDSWQWEKTGQSQSET